MYPGSSPDFKDDVARALCRYEEKIKNNGVVLAGMHKRSC
jgi:hypothetical protein